MQRALVATGLLALTLTAGCKSDPSASGPGVDGGAGASGDAGDGDGDSSAAGDASNIDFDGQSGTSDGDLVECAESEAGAQLVPANLLFVVDKSGSMNCNAPPVDELCLNPLKKDKDKLSKWEITQEALTGSNGALATLAGQEGISSGLITFPTDDFCSVPGDGEITVDFDSLSSEQLSTLTEELTTKAEGQTPLAGAAIRGLNALRDAIDRGEIEGNHYLVLMTDGAETCQISALSDLLYFVEQARYYYGIKTYAIGAPGSEASRDLLSEIALLGGTQRSDSCKKRPENAGESCHIDLTESDDFEGELGAEFKGITEETTQVCEYDVPSDALVDRNKVNVEFTPGDGETELVPQDPPPAGAAQCQGADGWQFSADGTKIVLCGKLCDRVLSDPESDVRVVFGCKDTVVR